MLLNMETMQAALGTALKTTLRSSRSQSSEPSGSLMLANNTYACKGSPVDAKMKKMASMPRHLLALLADNLGQLLVC